MMSRGIHIGGALGNICSLCFNFDIFPKSFQYSKTALEFHPRRHIAYSCLVKFNNLPWSNPSEPQFSNTRLSPPHILHVE